MNVQLLGRGHEWSEAFDEAKMYFDRFHHV